MTADYTPQVGDRVMADGEIGFVLAIDGHQAWIKWDDGRRWTSYANRLTKVTPPPTYPDRWINVYPDDVYGRAWDTRIEADTRPYHTRIAVIHLAADGTVTLHPVERES